MATDNLTKIRHEYQEFTKRTFAYSGNHDLDIYHCLIGVLSESIEHGNEDRILQDMINNFEILPEQLAAQRVRVRKEYGDVCYYLAMLGNLVQIKFDRLTDGSMIDFELGNALEALADTLKKAISYKHVIRAEDLIRQYKHTVSCVHIMMTNRNINFYDILQENRAKLEARYPSGKFDSNDAANKADEQKNS